MIKSNTFGGVALSGDDARKFELQVRYGRPSVSAQEALKRGDALLAKFGGVRWEAPRLRGRRSRNAPQGAAPERKEREMQKDGRGRQERILPTPEPVSEWTRLFWEEDVDASFDYFASPVGGIVADPGS